MKFVPSEFSNSAWDIFILSKEIAQNNFQQNIDSENILPVSYTHLTLPTIYSV